MVRRQRSLKRQLPEPIHGLATDEPPEEVFGVLMRRVYAICRASRLVQSFYGPAVPQVPVRLTLRPHQPLRIATSAECANTLPVRLLR